MILFFACAAVAERQPLKRYKTIVDRQMFGQPPPDFDPTKPANQVTAMSRAEQKELSQEEQKLQSAVQFSVINITPEGETAVGFSDNSDPKVPKHYYLKVGEERDGWLVKEADPARRTMTIAKGEIEVSLSLGENSAKNGTTAKADGAASPAPRFGGGLRARRMARQAELQKRDAADKARAEEERARREEKEAEREAQRQAEREEQKRQLQAIQQELRRVRESRQQKQQTQETGENAGDESQ